MKRIHPLEPPYEPEVDRTLQRMMGATGLERACADTSSTK